MKTTCCFQEQILRERPGTKPDLCRQVIAAPIRRMVQKATVAFAFGARSYGPEIVPRILRVVTLDGGETVHDAFFDRGFRGDPP